MPVRVVWGDNKPGMLMYSEMLMSGILLLDVLLSFNTGARDSLCGRRDCTLEHSPGPQIPPKQGLQPPCIALQAS